MDKGWFSNAHDLENQLIYCLGRFQGLSLFVFHGYFFPWILLGTMCTYWSDAHKHTCVQSLRSFEFIRFSKINKLHLGLPTF
jgi:hypothetical protein